ncbi:MAG: hypothetical protein ACK5Y6_00855 [Pseudomonadota bacterium]|jgi:hypothetical protein
MVKQPSQIIRKAKKRKSARPAWTKEQEQRYRELTDKLEQAGFIVRREELKRGHCWKVVSGTCRSLSQRFVFVDSRLAPQEQVAFLEGQLADFTSGDAPVKQAA